MEAAGAGLGTEGAGETWLAVQSREGSGGGGGGPQGLCAGGLGDGGLKT